MEEWKEKRDLSDRTGLFLCFRKAVRLLFFCKKEPLPGQRLFVCSYYSVRIYSGSFSSGISVVKPSPMRRISVRVMESP